MPNITAPYNKILYVILKTLCKITTTPGIYPAKTHYFEIQSFWELEFMHYFFDKN